MMYRTFAAVLTMFLAVAPAAAHPGHGHTAGNSLMHYLTEPNHVLTAVGLVIGVVLVGLVMRTMSRTAQPQRVPRQHRRR